MARESATTLGLPRGRRLKQARDFARARAQGKRVASGCLVANWLVKPPGSPHRLGVITSRKVGKAVVRSRARRLLREAFRVHQPELAQPLDLVLVARPSIVDKSLSEVERDLLSALRRAGVLTKNLP